jgi:hypothetical protein
MNSGCGSPRSGRPRRRHTAGRRGPAHRRRRQHRFARRTAGPRRSRSAAFCPAASPSNVKSPERRRRPTTTGAALTWPSPKAVPQVATAVGIPPGGTPSRRCSLDHDGLMLPLRSRGGLVQAVQHLALLVRDRLGVFRYLGPASSASRRAPNPTTSPTRRGSARSRSGSGRRCAHRPARP